MKVRFRLIPIVLTLIVIFSYKASAQDITTGDATSETTVENVVNTNIIRCCTPTPPKSTPTPPAVTPTTMITPTPTLPESPTPTPTSKPSNGGEGEQPGGGGGVGGPSSEVLGVQAQKQGEVLGLSTTSSGGNPLIQLLQLFGSLTLGITGFTFFKKNA